MNDADDLFSAQRGRGTRFKPMRISLSAYCYLEHAVVGNCKIILGEFGSIVLSVIIRLPRARSQKLCYFSCADTPVVLENIRIIRPLPVACDVWTGQGEPSMRILV